MNKFLLRLNSGDFFWMEHFFYIKLKNKTQKDSLREFIKGLGYRPRFFREKEGNIYIGIKGLRKGVYYIYEFQDDYYLKLSHFFCGIVVKTDAEDFSFCDGCHYGARCLRWEINGNKRCRISRVYYS